MSFLLGLHSCFIVDSTLTKNKPSLDNVPVELVERIAKDLDLSAIYASLLNHSLIVAAVLASSITFHIRGPI